MVIQDDRTPATHKTHSVLITATDKMMSGWRCFPPDSVSKVAWCCRPEHANLVYQWVKSQRSYKYVNRNKASWCPRKARHVRYYVISDGHQCLGGAS